MGGRELLHGRSRGFALSRLAALIVVSVGLAAPSAHARWLAPQSVGHSKISFMLVNSPFVPSEIQIDRELYGASAHQLLERLRRVADEVDAVMLIGHNPAIQDLTVSLVAGAGGLAARKFPTGALAALTSTGPWRALEPSYAELAAFVTPRELG